MPHERVQPDAIERQPCTRRQLLEIGAATPFGLSLPQLLLAGDSSGGSSLPHFGQAKSCVVIFLWGGPGQQDLWDPKPQAPSAVRSEFAPIATSLPGIQVTDQLPHLAKQVERFTIVRSVTHRDFEHGSAAYTALTGHPHPLPGTNTTARPDDFPTYGSVLTRLTPTSEPVPDFVVLGPVMHQGARPPLAGQNAGFLGPGYDAFRIAGDPSSDEFRVAGVSPQEDLSDDRYAARHQLVSQLDNRQPSRGMHAEGLSELYRRAFGLLGSEQTRRAFLLDDEKAGLRDAYGRTKFGQTLLLARRLVEARVPLVTLNWSKLNADQWDTHSNNYGRLRKMLPPFDRSLAMFLQDLDERGLLDETLVVCLGEFGRTAKINKDAGRDHWPDCYSLLLAGAGIHRGVAYGASNRTASYPVQNDVAPWDIAATMYHLMGIDPHTHLVNRQGQPIPLAKGQVVTDLLS
ncbi:MAG: DUF1501 domain-containing protein [Planctomycetota bacterium]|jgi:hypothetical protein